MQFVHQSAGLAAANTNPQMSQMLTDAPRISQIIPDDPTCSHMLPDGTVGPNHSMAESNRSMAGPNHSIVGPSSKRAGRTARIQLCYRRRRPPPPRTRRHLLAKGLDVRRVQLSKRSGGKCKMLLFLEHVCKVHAIYSRWRKLAGPGINFQEQVCGHRSSQLMI